MINNNYDSYANSEITLELPGNDYFVCSDEMTVREDGIRTTQCLLEAMMGDWGED